MGLDVGLESFNIICFCINCISSKKNYYFLFKNGKKKIHLCIKYKFEFICICIHISNKFRFIRRFEVGTLKKNAT